MAHGLVKTNGMIPMAYRGDVPWHGMGSVICEGDDLETIGRKSGMDFEIAESKVFYSADAETPALLTYPDYKVLYRKDNHKPLGNVSSKYKTVQPKQIMNFFADVVKAGHMVIETAGVLFGGKRFWCLARMADADQTIRGADRVGGFVLLMSSADGSLATNGRFTSIRVVCNNTLSMANAEGKAAYSVSHRSIFDEVAAKSALDMGRTTFDQFIADMRKLAEVEMSPAQQNMALATILAKSDKPVIKNGEVLADNLKLVMDSPAYNMASAALITSPGAQMLGAKNTAWGTLNALTFYVDHQMNARTPENRFASAMMGDGMNLKAKGLKELLALVD